MSLVQHLNWRYATQQFDATQKVAEEDINYIKEAARLSASSYGLQPYTIFDIRQSSVREKLYPLAHHQTPVVDASHLFLFCNHLQVTDKEVNQLMHLKASAYNVPYEKLAGYGEFIKSKLKLKTAYELSKWTSNQTYIALANAMDACAELAIDSLPMEGFDTDAFNQHLNLTKKGLNASVMLAIGYRHESDKAQYRGKVRKPIEELFIEL